MTLPVILYSALAALFMVYIFTRVLPLPRLVGFGLPIMFILAPMGVMAASNDLPVPGGLDLGAILKEFIDALGQWKTGGAIAGLIALVSLTMKLMQLDFIDDWLGTRRWLKPLIAATLGAALAFLTALSTGTSIIGALLAGILAGLGSAGFHEFTVAFNADKKAERAIGAAMAKLMTSDTAGTNSYQAAHDAITQAAQQPTPSARLQALAAYANANPPSR